MSKRKITIINNVKYEEMGPYCKLCNGHMGKYYYSQGKRNGSIGNGPLMFINPHNYESYGDNICPKCGTKYEYEEGNMIVLSAKDKKALLTLRKKG
jgi:hypothetical protein